MSYFGAIAFCVMVNGTTEKCPPPKIRREEYATEEACKRGMAEYMPYHERGMKKEMEQQSQVLFSDLKLSFKCLPAVEAAKLPRYPAS